MYHFINIKTFILNTAFGALQLPIEFVIDTFFERTHISKEQTKRYQRKNIHEAQSSLD